MKGVLTMEQDNHFRHEMKYYISYPDYLAVRSRVRAVMDHDTHVGPTGFYHIRSVYFDNDDDKALKEKIDGVAKREKFRIRYYNNDFSFITLEKKMKIDDLCLKKFTVINEEEARKIFTGDIEFMRDHKSDLARELYAKMIYQRMKPKVLVSYLREPYIYIPGNVRVTFDSHIRTTLFHKEFLEKKVNDISATDAPDDMIMEVKFDAFLPRVIQDIVQVPGIRQQAFSKYGACRRFG